jgi:lipopolysaccharide/colanic/teichoic acid biosynthesis glycosyltransferase
LNQEENKAPEVIICEARFDVAAIRQFRQALRQHPIFQLVPFVLDGSGLTEQQLAIYKENTRPDEILFLDNCSSQSLEQKISFLRRVKSVNNAMLIPRIEESIPVNYNIGLFLKRAFDIVVSATILLLLSPIFLLIALAIRLESRGPIFYIAKRAGKGYKIFDFYKFRTMVQDADKKISDLKHLNQYSPESSGPVFFKISNDPRITRVGSFLRNSSLDELPQLLNVFLGDMSLVGNRPLPLYEAATLTTDDYAARFLAPAGITGLWQVKKRGNKDMSVEERINMDIDYASNCTFATDLWIIANTPSALLQKENV